MTFEGGEEGVPRRRRMMHYHGDEVRMIFFMSALVLIVAQSTGADLPFSTMGAVSSAVLLVIAAGITNPDQPWIHWLNALLAAAGTILFSTTAIEHYNAGMNILAPSFLYTEALALLSLIALYFTTRTIRGLLQRSRLI